MSNDRTALFQSINCFFDHIYILTIDRAKERHKRLAEDLAGLNYSLFFGIDKNAINLDELSEKNIYNEKRAIEYQRYSRSMRQGEVACSMGHRAICEEMLKKGFQKILILEDDVICSEEGLQNFTEMINELPVDWDVLYFDYNKNTTNTILNIVKRKIYHLQKLIGHLKWSHQTIDNLNAKKYSLHLKKSGYHDYASAYGITNNAARKLVSLNTPICFPADHVLPYAITNNLLKGFITIPKVFIQQSQLNKGVVGSYVEEGE